MEYKLKQISDEIRTEIIEILKKRLENEPLLFVYLFGSFAIGSSFNDVDVAVFVDTKKLSSKPLLDYELELEQRLSDTLKGYKVDVRVLNEAPLSFRYQVIKTGLPIIIYDEDAMVDFETLTYSLYFDFALFRKAYLKEVLGA
ncbi:MAG: type VII toxin-antitoxin system MntA family adenylyltransferase antitoxin [bacterium]